MMIVVPFLSDLPGLTIVFWCSLQIEKQAVQVAAHAPPANVGYKKDLAMLLDWL